MSSAPLYISLYIALLILQDTRRFTYVTAHSPTPPSLYLRHSSFNPSVALPTSQLILQPFRCFTYVKVHSPTIPSLHVRHNSFSNPSVALPTSSSLYNTSVASPTSQLILQPLFRFSYVTSSSLNSPSELPMSSILLTTQISLFVHCLFNNQ